jgi:ADP-heptose:LPS heptosyltransferase
MAAQALRPFVFKLGRIGDMVMLTAALRLLHERYGEPCQVVGADAWVPDVYLGSADVERCWALPRKAPSILGTAWPAILWSLRASAPGPVHVFEHHPGQVRRIRRLLSLSGIDPRRCLYIGEAPRPQSPWADALLRFARQLPAGLSAAAYPEPPLREWLPRLRVLDAERAERDRWLREIGFRGEPLIVVQPGNHRTMGRRRLRNWRGRDDKVWPAQRWAQLLRRLHAHMPEALLILRGAAPERPLLESIRALAGLPRVTVRAVSGLRPLFALCEAAHSMISVDSGPAHAAAALGVPLVVLYGAQSPQTWTPRSSNGSPVLAVGGPPRFERADQIAADTVFAAWRSLAAGMGTGRGAAAAQAAAQADFELTAPLLSQTTSVTMEPSALSSSVR